MAVDKLGYKFTVGCKVVRPIMAGNSPVLDICQVTAIVGDDIFLDNSKKAIRIPHRLLIIEHDPLIKILNDFERSNRQ